MTAPQLSDETLRRLLAPSCADFPYRRPRGTPVRRRFTGIRAIFFDFYDTLVLAESRPPPGGADPSSILPTPVLLRLRAAGAFLPGSARQVEDRVAATIAGEHLRRRHSMPGLLQPEIDLRSIWRDTFGWDGVPAALVEETVARWEAWTTRTRAADGAGETLARLRALGLRLGIGSNAQFMAPALFALHFGAAPAECGFDPALLVWSWQLGLAKPDPRFFEALASAALSRGIHPPQVLFVGNDPERDIAPARSLGFATCLYAGDTRCLRGDGTGHADAVLTDFRDLPALLG